MGVKVHACRANVRDRQAVERFIDEAKEKWAASTSSSN
jgi:hypothetical protein